VIAARERPRDCVGGEIRIVSGDQPGQVPADELRHRYADQRGESLVDRLDVLAVQQGGLAHGGEHRAGAVDGRTGACARRRARGCHLVRKLPQPAPLQQGDDGQHGGKGRERDASDHRDRHAACHPLWFRAAATTPSFSLCSAAAISISHACTGPRSDSP
jgi:hypothetical protein